MRTDHLITYIPTDRLHSIATGRPLPTRQRGAVLLVDISGFTPLTEQVVRDFGPRRGGEELTRHLNAVYGALIDEIERFRGSVIGFSGDAITCWFDEDPGIAATRCAWSLQRVSRQFAQITTPSGDTLSLAIKVAVTAGDVRRFAVGNPGAHLVDVLCGSVLDRVARAEVLAQRGGIVVGAEVAAACGDRIVIAGWPEPEEFATVGELREVGGEPAGWPALSLEALDQEQLRPWLLPAVYQRLASGQGEYLAELRQVVAMFVKFEGLAFERDPEVGQKLDAYIRWVQSILQRYEGALIQVTTGDKGNYLYAAFGAPLAHEDAPERAMGAALELRSPPPEISFITRTQIGVSRGQMRTGEYGGTRRRTYGVLGDETNVAARLMTAAAPGQVLGSERVVKSCKIYKFKPLGEIKLKGKQSAVPVFELRGRPSDQRRRRSATREPLVGRDLERALLQRAIDELHARAGEPGRLLLVEGEPGIGKSRLIGDLLDTARRMQAPPIRCLITRANAIESSVPYLAWRSIFANALELPPAIEPAEALAYVQARLPGPLAALAPLLGVVLQLPLPETPTTTALTGALRVAQTQRFLAQLFAALFGREPTLLVIEDAHFLDSASYATLELLLGAPGRLLVALAARPQRTPPEQLERLRRAPTTQRIRVSALSPAEVVALTSQHLGIEELPDEVASFVCRVAEGNPLFAQELVRALLEARLLEVTDGVCRAVAALDRLPFPDSIEGVVTSRIDRLPPAEQLTLKVASVIGREFRIGPLRELFPIDADRDRVTDSLAMLSQAGLTTPGGEAAEASYSFTHATTHDVAYNLMLFEQRRVLHEKMADWCERAIAHDPAAYAAVAYHRVRAIEGLERPDAAAVKLAVDAVTRAGRRSVEAGATTEAIQYLTHARSLLGLMLAGRERDLAELDLCSCLGTALAVIRGPTDDEVRREFARARALSAELGDRSRLFETLFNLWWANMSGSERDSAIETSGQLLELAGADTMMRLLACQTRGATLISIGRHVEGLALMQEALGIVERSPSPLGAVASVRDPDLMARCYAAWASTFVGYLDQGVAQVNEAIELSSAVAHAINRAQALCFAGHVHRYRREPAATAGYVERAKAIEPEHGSPFWIGIRVGLEAWVAMARGEVAASVAMLEELARRERQTGFYPLAWIITRADLIEGLTQLGRHDEALAIVEEAKAVLGTRLLGFGEPDIHRLEGEIWRRRADPARALACYQRARDTARAHQARTLELRALTCLARLDPSHVPALRERYRWFTEGKQLPDLADARAVLAAAPEGPNLEAVEDYVLERLGRELSPLLTYHDLEHTRDDVVPAVKRLAALHGLSDLQTTLVTTAAWFHDLGFIERREGHEQVGIRIAREVLPRLGYPGEDIETIAAIIAATKLPQSPRAVLEQLMADADLDVLGRPDFLGRNERLRIEHENHGEPAERGAWYASQIEFVRQHRYFTGVAEELRAAGKRDNLAALARRLDEHRRV